MAEHHDYSRRLRLDRRGRLAIIAAGLLALGGAAGAVVMAETQPTVTMAPATPVAIRTLSTGIATVRGRVAEIYGNKFILQDGGGRALVDTGREGDERQLVTTGQMVTVQGRFDRGFMHAAFLVGPDGQVLALGPLAGPPHGPRDHADHGPDDPSPPPLGAAGKAPPVAPALGATTTSQPPASTQVR